MGVRSGEVAGLHQIFAKYFLIDGCGVMWCPAAFRRTPSPDPIPPFFKIKFYFISMKFYNGSQCVPRRHKNKHRSE